MTADPAFAGERRPKGAQLTLLVASAIVAACVAAFVAATASASDRRENLSGDDFARAAAWHVLASDDVVASAREARGPHGPAIGFQFDLRGTAGYAGLQRAMKLDLPSNFEISFDIRGGGPRNNFQFKLVDASGDNVWWVNRPNFAFTHEWTRIVISKRQLEFAWGPAKDHTLTHAATVEFVVSAGEGGGRGAVYFSNFAVRKLAPVSADGSGDTRQVEQTPNAMFEALARRAPRGTYPRALSGEQSAWTLVGVDGGGQTALLSEDGALEVSKGGFSIEPFVVVGSRVFTWADVDAEPFLVDGYLPMPGVTWQQQDWQLRVSTFATGDRSQSQLIARYDVSNRSAKALKLTLVLAARPFQVNPPSQFLNFTGGVSSIRDVAWDGGAFAINGRKRAITPLRAPDRVGAFAFAAGPIPTVLADGGWTNRRIVRDPSGYATAAVAYDLLIPASTTVTLGLVVPLAGDAPTSVRPVGTERWLSARQDEVAAAWRKKLNRVALRVPAQAQPLVDTMRTALAHLLITRDGPILRPGTRSYARSWIRDGAMISEALLRLGYFAEPAAYVRWYAAHQFHSGKIPCCIDPRGADPVPENDSFGEFAFLAAEVWRFSGDRSLITALWPRVEAASAYVETLRQSQRTMANLTGSQRSLYGLLPASISHEGYSAKPMHSYWDDFWTLKGYNGAITIATALGHTVAAEQLSQQRSEFRHDLVASLRAAVVEHQIDYLPGAAELGDFDPTSTSIAFAPDGDIGDLPLALVQSTYERYWREFIDRRDGNSVWEDYTPYEMRTVGTFVRLGWRGRAQQALDFFLDGRRPHAWNQWPEVIGRDFRKPRFIGDMPHAWVASDFINAVLDFFVYERSGDHSLVLAAGVPASWLQNEGVTVSDLHTAYGRLSYSLRQTGKRATLKLDGDAAPPGHLVFTSPWPIPPRITLINGRPAVWRGNELDVGVLPAVVEFDGISGEAPDEPPHEPVDKSAAEPGEVSSPGIRPTGNRLKTPMTGTYEPAELS